VAYNNKRNEANGENNKDGESHNLSWNCGEEGPTPKVTVNRCAGGVGCRGGWLLGV
jgi:pullulanase/glycogen debranching enzyme